MKKDTIFALLILVCMGLTALFIFMSKMGLVPDWLGYVFFVIALVTGVASWVFRDKTAIPAEPKT